jgi:hypothetical protein
MLLGKYYQQERVRLTPNKRAYLFLGEVVTAFSTSLAHALNIVIGDIYV